MKDDEWMDGWGGGQVDLPKEIVEEEKLDREVIIHKSSFFV